MATLPILILDDGELEDVVEILERLGQAFVRLRGGAIPERVDPPSRLLIATARRAAIGSFGPTPGGHPRPVRIAVVEEDSNTLRSRLRGLGFDWLVRRPVHPHALRLVLMRALFEGRERRIEERLPVGTPVFVRSGLRRREAVMADLSIRGCRLLMRERLAPGARVTVQVPREATGGRGISLRARVVRSSPAEEGSSTGVIFERLSRDAQGRIFRLLQERARGPAVLPRQERERTRRSGAGDGPGADAARPPLEPSSAGDRRKHPRVAYRELVRGEAEEAHLALVGRDLSAGGMRIAPHPALAPGDRIVLHLYGEPAEDPVPVSGFVARDQGDDGLAIRFDPLPPQITARIEALVASLPAVEDLAGSETDALGSIVSRIVEREAPEPESEDVAGDEAGAGEAGAGADAGTGAAEADDEEPPEPEGDGEPTPG